MNTDSMRTDLAYAMRQLRRAVDKQYRGEGCGDELSRAMDGLERVEEALAAAVAVPSDAVPVADDVWDAEFPEQTDF